jgi:hypothetical protein
VEIPIVGRETCQADYEGINGVDEGKPEMEFLNMILVEVYGHELESGFLPSFFRSTKCITPHITQLKNPA